ncbi:MAG: hypothetical protein ACRCUZ_13405 [Shewanella sp.]
MNINESITLRGELSITLHQAGRPPKTLTEHNMIMASAKSALARLIAGQGSGKNITRIAFGTSGTGPSPDDAAITGAYTKALAAAEFPAAGQVKFGFSLAESEANGLNIRELGLLCADGTLFARKVRGMIEKTSDLSITGSWTIIF